jgi:tetratricopeptide (TPR) repeat protein
MRVLATILLLTLASASAWAQVQGTPEAKQKARDFFRTGTQHYDLGEFPEALHDFKEAYRFYEEPIFLFNIGQCHRQMGQKEQAIRFFKVYLSKNPNAVNKADVKDMIAKLEVAWAEERKSQTGKPQGTLAPPEIKTETPEAKPETKPAPPPPVTKTEPPPPAPVTTQPASTTVTAQPAPVEKTPVYKKWWLWTAVGVVVVAGVGIGLGVGLSSSGSTPSATTDFGTYRPF